MAMYNLLEYSDNHADSSGSLWQFKRDEQNMNDANPPDVTTVTSSSFKYKSSLLENPAGIAANAYAGMVAHALLSNAKIVVPLKFFQVIRNATNQLQKSFRAKLEQRLRNV